MKTNKHHLMALAAAAVMVGFCSTASVQAQGNFDPAQFRQRALDNYRERLEVKSEDDWNKLEPLITKVMDAQRDARAGMGGFGGGFGGGRGGRGGGGGGGGGGGDQANAGRNRGGGGGGNPDADALRKALDDKAPADEVKAKLAKLRDSRKEKEAALAKAQEDLRKALSPRQEAAATLVGLVK
jgi:hypothetical protein